MPNKWTFKIKPIKELVLRYVGDGSGWIDPFAGESSPAEFTNDINPERKTKYHLEALSFLNQFQESSCSGVLFDPPYSISALQRCYKDIGNSIEGSIKNKWGENNTFWKDRKIQSGKIIKPNGICISCGWSTYGIGKGQGFEIIEILLVCHGGLHNDTIVTVERKVNTSLDAYPPTIPKDLVAQPVNHKNNVDTDIPELSNELNVEGFDIISAIGDLESMNKVYLTSWKPFYCPDGCVAFMAVYGSPRRNLNEQQTKTKCTIRDNGRAEHQS